MRFRGLLVGLVVLVALVVGLYFSNKQEAAKAAKPKSDDAAEDPFPHFDRHQQDRSQEEGRRGNRARHAMRAVNGRSPLPRLIQPIRIPPTNWPRRRRGQSRIESSKTKRPTWRTMDFNRPS